jgi:hypothetical protein
MLTFRRARPGLASAMTIASPACVDAIRMPMPMPTAPGRNAARARPLTGARWFAIAAVVLASAIVGCGSDSGGRPGTVSQEPDLVCLRFLNEHAIPFIPGDPVTGVRTPVELRGPVRGIRLSPRAGRAALMDCELLRALWEAGPVLAQAGVDELSFSGAYDYRTRHGSSQLSAHAFGLAIDVHEFRGPSGNMNIARDFEKGAGRWRGIVTRAGDIEGCIGSPRTSKGRRLRRLVCELKHHSAFRVIVTPDDNDDHRDHIHIETFADSETRVARVMGGFR